MAGLNTNTEFRKAYTAMLKGICGAFQLVVTCFLFFVSAAQGLGKALEDTTRTVSRDTVKLVAWNVYMLPTPFNTKSQLLRARAITEILRKADYDVVVLQEVFKGKIFKYFIDSLKGTFPHFYTTPFKARFLKTTSGLLVLSKLPIKQTASVLFEDCKGSDCIAQKGALLVEVEKNNKRVQIIGTHLQAEENDAAQVIRDKQYKQIAGKLMKPFERHNVPQVVAGDLNTSKYKDKAKFYDRMLKIFGAEDCARPHYRDKKLLSYDGSQNDVVRKVWKSTQDLLDYILVRKNKTSLRSLANIKIFRKQWRKENRDLSDHYAIEAMIVLD